MQVSEQNLLTSIYIYIYIVLNRQFKIDVFHFRCQNLRNGDCYFMCLHNIELDSTKHQFCNYVRSVSLSNNSNNRRDDTVFSAIDYFGLERFLFW